MLQVTLSDKKGDVQSLNFEKEETVIGRISGNDIVLPEGNVSKHHARLRSTAEGIEVVDLLSTNGTFVGVPGEKPARLDAPRLLRPNEKVFIGDWVLECSAGQKRKLSESRQGQLRKEVHERLIEALDLRRLDVGQMAEGELRGRAEACVRDIVNQMAMEGELSGEVDRRRLLQDVLNEALGLGPLEELLADDEVTEIMVNHSDQIYIERKGKLTPSGKSFSSNQAVLAVIERIVAPIGRRIDESSPLVDARLKDGSRVNAIIPPLALKGPCITIRKFKREAFGMKELIEGETLTSAMAEFLTVCVRARKNIVIAGGTGSGKTTTLNVISSLIPKGERIITVEDAAELQLAQPHWVQLESRPSNVEGKGAIPIRELVKNCLRMRPDRILVGECRSGEALDMLQAMNTGHDGSITTLHANSPRDALSRLETMVLMAGMDLPVRVIREQIASAVHVLVQQTRFADGSRKICSIAEVTGMEGEIITLQDIFYFNQSRLDDGGRVRGEFRATGFVPKFCEDLRRRGLSIDPHLFSEEPA